MSGILNNQRLSLIQVIHKVGYSNYKSKEIQNYGLPKDSKDKSNRMFQYKIKYKVARPIQFHTFHPMKFHSLNESCLIRPASQFTRQAVNFEKSRN